MFPGHLPQFFKPGRIFALAGRRSYPDGGSRRLCRPFYFFQYICLLPHRRPACRRMGTGCKRWKQFNGVPLRDSCRGSYSRLYRKDWSFCADMSSSHNAAFVLLLRSLGVFVKFWIYIIWRAGFQESWEIPFCWAVAYWTLFLFVMAMKFVQMVGRFLLFHW